jgi:hypothetical protein
VGRFGGVGSLLAVVCVLAGGTEGAAPAVGGGRGEVALAPISRAKLEHCERSALLRPVCPRLVPRVSWYLSSLAVEEAGPGRVLDVFNLEHGGEDPRHPERNGPPRMAHVVVTAGGDLLMPFRAPRGASGGRVRAGLLREPRREAVAFGRVRWAGRSGWLYLAPPFPTGGMLGNHLVFDWRQSDQPYTLSLHAWEPLSETAAVLEAIVESLPTLAETERLRRLAVTRTLATTPAHPTARARITTPAGQHALTVFVIAPARADVEVRLETARGERIPIVDSTRHLGRCNTRPPYRLCFVLIPAEDAPPGGAWTIVATSHAERRTRVRVDINLH